MSTQPHPLPKLSPPSELCSLVYFSFRASSIQFSVLSLASAGDAGAGCFHRHCWNSLNICTELRDWAMCTVISTRKINLIVDQFRMWTDRSLWFIHVVNHFVLKTRTWAESLVLEHKIWGYKHSVWPPLSLYKSYRVQL